MRRLSFLIFGLLFSISVFSQKSPHGNQLQIDCSECHTTGSWLVNSLSSKFDHEKTGFSLIGQHKQIDCKLCHLSLNFFDQKGQTDCASCHLDVHQQNLGNDCSSCHTPESWIIDDVSEIHNNSRFPLVGPHKNADCFDCHLSENLLQFRPMGIECIDCHRSQYLATTEPSHQEAGFSTDCLECHSISSAEWASGGVNHDFFPLTEGHAILNCYLCHDAGSFQTLSPNCESCHLPNYNSTTNPPHTELNFSVNCLDCHTTNPGWTPARFDVHNDFYVLEGAHAIIASDCASCHANGYVNTPNTCNGCHTNEYNNTTTPSHLTSNFPTDCAVCHTQNAWEPSTFAHNSTFPLTQGHSIVDCFECHVQNNYGTLSPNCETCHLPNYNSTTNPPHTELNFPVNCLDCHTTIPGWTPARFDIHSDYYVLEGAHAIIASDCASCHTNGYVNTPNTCFACHTNEYNNTVSPAHLAASFPTDCTVCHTQNAWIPSTFAHSTTFPLTQGHLIADCYECHVQNNYQTLSPNCETCHLPNYNSTTNPPHAELNFPVNCLDCHTTIPGWTPAKFDIHNDFYVLEGAHAIIASDCASCHSSGYVNTPNTCFGCHANDYNNTNSPNHLTVNFPTDCSICHTQNVWVPSTFAHSTTFPLTEGHLIVDCLECHLQNNYQTLSPDCETCHLPNYNSTLNPPHKELNFPVNCLDCHTTKPGWTPAKFDIHNNYYVLEGAHATIANECTLCHASGYINTPNTCYGCHTNDYNSANNPPHSSASFPIDCTACHSQNAWSPSTFDHDGQYFPIYSGKHKGEWSSCADCHTVSSNYSVFSCITCHEHNKTDMDSEHRGKNGYVYNSANCFECHPKGNAD